MAVVFKGGLWTAPGRGRWERNARPTTDETPSISVRELGAQFFAVAGAVRYLASVGVWVRRTATGIDFGLDAKHNEPDGSLRVVGVPCHLPGSRDGRRWWWLCGRCDRRSAILYLPGPGRAPACRACLGLSYASQREKPPARAARKAAKLRRMLGEQDPKLWGDLPGRPKGVRWKTYLRWISEITRLEMEAIGALIDEPVDSVL